MRDKKKHIDTYSTAIYPVDIVVANESAKLEDLKKEYMYSDEAELDDRILDCVASTSTCKRKSDGKYFVLIKYSGEGDKKRDEAELISDITHEAVHAALDIFDFIHETVSYDYQECIAYLTGYIASCVYKTVTKK